MTNFYAPDVYSANLLDNLYDNEIKLSEFIDGVPAKVLNKKTPITQRDISFRFSDESIENKKKVVDTLNKIREMYQEI